MGNDQIEKLYKFSFSFETFMDLVIVMLIMFCIKNRKFYEYEYFSNINNWNYKSYQSVKFLLAFFLVIFFDDN